MAKSNPSGSPAVIERIAWSLHAKERRVLHRIAERLLEGQTTYGPFAARDKRDMRREAQEEFLDASVYLAVQMDEDGDSK